MTTMFRLGWGGISEFEVIKTSDKSVWYMAKRWRSDEMYECRDLLKTNDHEWFKTKKEAIDAFIDRLSKKVYYAKSSLLSAEDTLQKAIEEYQS